MLSTPLLRISLAPRTALRPPRTRTMAPKRAAPPASGSRKSLRTASASRAAPAAAAALQDAAEEALEEQLPELDDALLLAAADEAERRASVPRSSQEKAAKPQAAAAPGLLVDDADPLAMERRTMHPEWFGRLEKSMAAPSFKQVRWAHAHTCAHLADEATRHS